LLAAAMPAMSALASTFDPNTLEGFRVWADVTSEQ
jgi:hypothetical protein